MSIKISPYSGDFLIEVEKGNVVGHSIIHKSGRNDAVPNDSVEFVNLLGFTGWPLSAATTVRVKAGNAADTSSGAGAREITIQGIDSNLNEIKESIATAGTSASNETAASFWRVHRAYVSAVGTYGVANTAAMVIENAAGGTDLIQIAAGEGQSQFAGWSVPIGKTAYLLSIWATVEANKAADIKLLTRENFNITIAPKSIRLRNHWNGVEGTTPLIPQAPLSPFDALTDIWFEAQGRQTDIKVCIDFELLVVDNQ
jgi:hypothetical protein